MEASLRKTGELNTSGFKDKLEKQQTMTKPEAKVENFDIADDIKDFEVPVVAEADK